MKRSAGVTVGLLGLVALMLTVSFFSTSSMLQQFNPRGVIQTGTPLTTCSPTPQLFSPDDNEPRTPTPNSAEFTLETPIPGPSVTPLPVSQTFDLAQELPDSEKVFVYVYRCNGTYELFMVRPGEPNSDISSGIPLNHGDIILFWVQPESMMGHQPPRVTSSPTASPLAPSTFGPPSTNPAPGTAYPALDITTIAP